jgi:aconitate hydratase
VVDHADGTRETLLLRHSYSAPQIDWFRAGSALNLHARST